MWVPANTVGPLHYRFYAEDNSSNNDSTRTKDVTVKDNDPPTFGNDASPNTAETDMSYTFNVTVEDNIGVDSVWVEYWYGNGSRTNATMDMEGGTWEHWMIVADTLEDLHYVIWCNDTSGNSNSTLERIVDVIDINGPQIINRGTKSTAYTGEPFEFTITAHDNVGLKRATLWYAFYDDELAPVEMEVIAAYPSSGNVLYSIFIDVPSNLFGNISYSYEVEDLYGNVLRSHVDIIRVRDNDPPEVVEDLSDTTATTGDPFTVWVEVADNIDMGAAQVVHWFTGGEQVTRDLELQYVSGDLNWTYGYSIDVPNDSIASLHYLLELTDAAGNTRRTEEREVPVLDDEPPTFGDDLSDEEAFRNQMFHFDVEFFVNIGVIELRCEWWFGMGGHLNATVPLDTRIAIDVPLHPEEPLRYFFSARDAAGNWNSTEVFERSVPNRPPAAGLPNPWEVGEEVDEELDMRDWILDPDSPWDEITVECRDPNVTVMGLVLQIRHDAWVPDYMIGVRVSDGNSSVLTFTTVHVVPVNDAPVIDQVLRNGIVLDPSVEVITFDRDGGGDLLVRATDEDGDELSYRWLRGEQVVATGDTVRAEDLPLGSYVLTVEVDDGTEVVSADLAVLVTEREEVSNWWAWALLIVIVVMIAVVGFVYWWSRDQTG